MVALEKGQYVSNNKYATVKINDATYVQFRRDRVNKLRELYEQCEPEIERQWVLPKGVTDGRKAIVVEKIIGEDISPFDLPEFNTVMPHYIDYVEEHKYDKE